MSIIDIFELILIKKRYLNLNVLCLYMYDRCSFVFLSKVYVNISTWMQNQKIRVYMSLCCSCKIIWKMTILLVHLNIFS
jgi:hypothetical protein